MAQVGPTTGDEYSPLLADIVEALGGVPTLPVIATRLLATIDDPSSSAGDVARLVAGDQALVANLLRMANSAYIGFGRQISSVTDAIVLVGLNGMRQMVLAISVIDVFRVPKVGEALDYTNLWRHSLNTAAAGRQLAPRAGLNLEAGFLCGLLHDLGKILLSRAKPDGYARAQMLACSEQRMIHQAELAVFGFDHGEIGAFAMDTWRFPSQLVRSARHHHCPAPGLPDGAGVAMVHVADAMMWDLTGVEAMGRPQISDEAARFLGVREAELSDLRAKSEAEAKSRWIALITG